MKKIIELVKSGCDIKNMSYFQASELAYDTAKVAGTVRSYEDIAKRLNLGTETVHRYFTDPQYNCPARKLPDMSRILGNTLMIEWQLAQLDAHMYFVSPEKDDSSLLNRMVSVRKEIGDLLAQDSLALKDNNYSPADMANLARELRDIITTADSALRKINQETVRK